ncbi:LOW QUALITY PROTEIN: major facilitator superfamily transporter, partial [Rhodococcus opacus PD630]
ALALGSPRRRAVRGQLGCQPVRPDAARLPRTSRSRKRLVHRDARVVRRRAGARPAVLRARVRPVRPARGDPAHDPRRHRLLPRADRRRRRPRPALPGAGAGRTRLRHGVRRRNRLDEGTQLHRAVRGGCAPRRRVVVRGIRLRGPVRRRDRAVAPRPRTAPVPGAHRVDARALALVWAVPDVRVRATDLTAKPLSVLATPQFRWGIAPWAPWVFGVATVSFATLPPLVSESLRSTSVAFTGLVAALTLITGAVIQPWATRWSKRGDAAAGIRVGIILGVLGFGAATVVAYTDGALSVAAIVVAAFLLGSCYGILLGSGLASVEKLAPADELAQTVAVFYCLIYVGFAVPFVMSLLAPHLGYATCFVGAALLMLLSVAVGRKVKDRHLTHT